MLIRVWSPGQAQILLTNVWSPGQAQTSLIMVWSPGQVQILLIRVWPPRQEHFPSIIIWPAPEQPIQVKIWGINLNPTFLTFTLEVPKSTVEPCPIIPKSTQLN